MTQHLRVYEANLHFYLPFRETVEAAEVLLEALRPESALSGIADPPLAASPFLRLVAANVSIHDELLVIQFMDLSKVARNIRQLLLALRTSLRGYGASTEKYKNKLVMVKSTSTPIYNTWR